MINFEKQVDYWRAGAREDWRAAKKLINIRMTRHGLFFAHLAIEKLLKAQICRSTKDLAPPIHNLIRLSELSRLKLDQSKRDILAEMNAFNIEGRYPDALAKPPSMREAKIYLDRAKKIYQWLMKQF